MAKKVGHLFVATADTDCVPHLAVAKNLTLIGNELVVVDEWYAPETVEKFYSTNRVSVIVWDRSVDRGFHLLGEVHSSGEEIVIGRDNRENRNQLLVMVEKAVDFSRFPHAE